MPDVSDQMKQACDRADFSYKRAEEVRAVLSIAMGILKSSKREHTTADVIALASLLLREDDITAAMQDVANCITAVLEDRSDQDDDGVE